MNDKLSKIMDDMILLQNDPDFEMAHVEADELLCKAVYELASDEYKRYAYNLITLYRSIYKEYA